MTLTEQNGLRILTADPGHLLHRNDEPTRFTSQVYLGLHDTPSNYTELTESQAAAIMNPPAEDSQEDLEHNQTDTE